ncbi:hypothetical protein [Cystobacter fuscus]|uniref:hypothetical protein n=1 Tax=Cystobacter fuscus TaxID=43 RepID=UPI002B2855B3|nr:hypothetical protein F0U63_01915 [Cystobacter fuscus]
MAPNESFPEGSSSRKKLIIGGVVVGIATVVGFIVWAARVGRQLDGFQQELLLSIVDKLVLASVVVLLGYLVQRQLEIFKRNQSLAAEWAKASIAAYNRAFAAIYSLDYAGFLVLDAAHNAANASKEQKKGASAVLATQSAAYDKESDALITILKTDQYLLGAPFCKAASRLVQQTRSDINNATGANPPDDEERMRRRRERLRLRQEIVLYVPAFARPPASDIHFRLPEFESEDPASSGEVQTPVERDEQPSKK